MPDWLPSLIAGFGGAITGAGLVSVLARAALAKIDALTAKVDVQQEARLAKLEAKTEDANTISWRVQQLEETVKASTAQMSASVNNLAVVTGQQAIQVNNLEASIDNLSNDLEAQTKSLSGLREDFAGVAAMTSAQESELQTLRHRKTGSGN